MQREINELEYLTLAVGQPFNIAVMLKIKGSVELDLLESTFEKLQKKHPLLRAKIIFSEKNIPFFTSEGVESIPITEIMRIDEMQAMNEFHKQLTTPFDLSDKNLPLIRVTMFSSPEISELIICSLHAISDGYSMVFLVRDMLKFLANPNEPINPIELPGKEVDLLIPKVKKILPKTSFFSRVVYILLRSYNFLRYTFTGKRKTAEINIKENEMDIYSTKLTEDQTTDFLARCKKERVTVHSAISTSFVQELPIIGAPVNLRNRLNQDIGESFGFYSGVAVYKRKYRKSQDFWQNAKSVQRKLLKGLRDRKLFILQKIFSKKAPLNLLRKIGTYYIEIVTNKKPFSIDNLGLLDFHLKDISFEKLPIIESFFGGITSFLDAFIVLFYTLKNEMHFYFHYTKSKYSREEIELYAETIKKRLNKAIYET